MKVCPKCNRLTVEYSLYHHADKCLARDCQWMNREKDKNKIARFSGVIDHNGVEVRLGDTVRWMACCGDCFKGTVDFRQNTDERIPFLSGFLVTKVKNITDEVMDENGNILGGWDGELEVIRSYGISLDIPERMAKKEDV